MSKENSAQKFLDMLSQFSIITKSYVGKRTIYSIPNLLDGEIPDLEQIKKLINPHKIKISTDNHNEIILIF
jgi:hypothetical protein